jgi:CO/xanthine dehydrogenase FAD-binding subunit
MAFEGRRAALIPFDFVYYKPDTLAEAVVAFQDADAKGLNPLYYGGGTEIISMGRVLSIRTGAVIDIKGIPECAILSAGTDRTVVGAGVTLSQISESGVFPLLGHAVGRIADHTIQCKLTLGGNLCGTIIYRESVLPLLLADSQVILYGPGGFKNVPIREVFDQRMRLNKGEIVVQVMVDNAYRKLPYVHVKKTPIEKIGYPTVTVCALKQNGRISAAFSGVCPFPFRSKAIEDILNNNSLTDEKKAKATIGSLPAPPLADESAGGEYRQFLLYHTLIKTLGKLGAA